MTTEAYTRRHTHGRASEAAGRTKTLRANMFTWSHRFIRIGSRSIRLDGAASVPVPRGHFRTEMETSQQTYVLHVYVCVYANTETLALGIGRFGSDLIEVEKHNINHLILFRAAVPSSCVSVSSVSLCPIHNMERGRIQTGRFVCVCDTRKGSG